MSEADDKDHIAGLKRCMLAEARILAETREIETRGKIRSLQLELETARTIREFEFNELGTFGAPDEPSPVKTKVGVLLKEEKGWLRKFFELLFG